MSTYQQFVGVDISFQSLKVARIAAAHKLVQVVWAVVSKQRAFDPLFPRSRSILSVLRSSSKPATGL